MREPVAGNTKSLQNSIIVWLIVVCSIVVASYWNSLFHVTQIWEIAEYSHGYLVPFLAFLLLWHRTSSKRAIEWGQTEMVGAALAGVAAVLLISLLLVTLPLAIRSVIGLIAILMALTGGLLIVRPPLFSSEPVTGRWWGVGLLTLAGIVRLYGTWHFAPSVDYWAFVLAIGGGVLLAGGWSAMKWAWPAVAVLLLMFRWPGPLRSAMIEPLQHFATLCSTYCLQTLGLPAFSDGNHIFVGAQQQPLSVVEACSGLRMLTVFTALSIAVALLSDRPLWERWVVLCSAIPIALFVNVVRITVTGVLYELAQNGFRIFGFTVTQEFANHVFHEWAGYFMMPMALVLMFLELQILPRILLEPEEGDTLAPLGFGGTPPSPRHGRQPVSASG